MKIKVLYDKSTKHLKRLLGRFIPRNTRFRPTGVCRIDTEDRRTCNNAEVKVHSIYPNLVTTLDISENLYDSVSEYWKPPRKVQTDYVVVEVPNGRIYTDNENSVAIVTQLNQLVENVSLSLTEGKVTDPAKNNIFNQSYFQAPTRFQGTVFSMLTGGAGLNNISHWFVDVLPRLHLLRESGLYDEVDWFLVPSTRYDYQTETLELLGIPSDKIITGAEYKHLTADRIIASTAPRGNHTLVPRWLCEFIQTSYFQFADEETELPFEDAPYLYISRSDSSIRRVLNEKELIEKLEPYGFKTVVSSKLNIKQKIKLFANAKVVMGACGAGLINFTFCRPGTKAIELFNEGFILEPFYDIANKINLDHHYIISKGNKNIKNAGHGQREHVVIEIDKVMNLLDELEIKPETRPKQRAQVI